MENLDQHLPLCMQSSVNGVWVVGFTVLPAVDEVVVVVLCSNGAWKIAVRHVGQPCVEVIIRLSS